MHKPDCDANMILSPKASLTLVLLFLAGWGSLAAQVEDLQLDYYLPAGQDYDPDIPTPQQYFGFQVGEWHLRPDQLVGYMRVLAESSARVTFEEYGRSHEQRPLVLLTITASENHADLERIRREHKALCDPRQTAPQFLEKLPLVVWLGYGVHGNEASASNAAPLVAYHLAAARGGGVTTLLDSTVVLLDPCFNPDGLGRFTQWVNSHRSRTLVTDPRSRELNEPWPRGRTNHYWFDLNRDWMPAQHPESRGRLKIFRDWMPNVLTDGHEMGSDNTYFFQPGIPSRNNPLTPERTFELTALIAEYHARALDAIGSLYYTRESFDDFYIGKGSTYPDLNGCIGILFEQASARGHLRETAHGLLSFPFAIRNQVQTSLSTLAASRAMRLDLLEHQREFFSSAAQAAQTYSVHAFVFGSAADRARTWHLVDILLQHEIEVHELKGSLRADGHSFEQGSAFVVPMQQANYRLARALFETRTSFRDSLFYDVSAWTLPLSFNLPYAELQADDLGENRLGPLLTSLPFPEGRRQGSSEYAYLFEWSEFYAARALNRLLSAGIIAKVAMAPFSIKLNGRPRSFKEGTILVPLGPQADKRDTIEALLQRAAEEDALTIYAAPSGLTEGGIDLGSPNFDRVRRPEVLILSGDGVYPNSAGEAWHLLDHRLHMQVSMRDVGGLAGNELTRYNVIVMVDGRYGSMDSSDVAALRAWLNKGGTLVATEEAVTWAIRQKLADAELIKSPPDTTRRRAAYAGLYAARGAQIIGGAIFEARLDRTHPLGFGYTRDALSVFRNNRVFLKPARNPFATPLGYTAAPLMSGYVSDANKALIAKSASIVVSAKGRGRVILMTDNPNFRAFWFGSNKLFMNAVFFGQLIDRNSARSDYEAGDGDGHGHGHPHD